MVDSAALIAQLASRGETIAVAESLTGGLLVAELIRPAGASAVVVGGVVAYNKRIKSSVLGVDPTFLAEYGPVNADVAKTMALNVRNRLAVGDAPASIGISTTGVAGPEAQGGEPPGIVFLGLSFGEETRVRRLELFGSRDEIRSQAVVAAIDWLSETLERGLVN